MELEIGAKIGQYRVEGVIGEGGMAIVYLIRSLSNDEPYALKVLSVTSRTLRERFLREGRVQRSMRHPNVVPVHEMMDVSGHPALVMDFVEGVDLELLMSRCSIDDRHRDQIARGVLRGVMAAHSNELVHRDLKPSNILVEIGEQELAARITDFGIAKLCREEGGRNLTQTGASMGTPGYMSPEQIHDSGAVDVRADVFSLGSVLYELMVGRQAFGGSNIMDVWSRVTTGDYVPVDAIRSDLPPAIVSAIHGALEPDLGRRFPDVRSLHEVWLEGSEELLGRLGAVDPSVETEALQPVRTLVTRHHEDILRARTALEEGGRWATDTIAPLLFGDGERHAESTCTSTVPTNLPEQTDRFIGRRKELQTIRERFDEGTRILTLLGPGGMGKTRLSQVFGVENGDRFPGGVWFFDLTETRTEEEVLRCVAAVLGVQLGEDDAASQLAHVIRARGPTLLIVDNMEQVANFADSTLGTWVQRAPEARFLVTSRVRLGLRAEEIFLLEALSRAEAVRLFVDRACRVQSDFVLGEDDQVAVEDIVERLDRMSLAIELAAARVPLMSPKQIRERLGQRFRLLRSGRRDQSLRQSTLRGAIDWSWELLHPGEKTALAQISIFRGGFTLEAAEAIVEVEDKDVWTIDILQSLVEQSLLRRIVSENGAPRFRMYESIREYAREKMSIEDAVPMSDGSRGTGKAAEHDLRLRFGRYFAGFACPERMDREFFYGNRESREHYLAEQDNFDAALEIGIEAVDADLWSRLLVVWVEVANWRGHSPDAVARLDRACSKAGIRTENRLRLLGSSSNWFYHAGRIPRAVELATEGLELSRSSDERKYIGIFLLALVGWSSWSSDSDSPYKKPEQRLEALEEARGIFHDLGDGPRESEAFLSLGAMFLGESDLSRAEEFIARGMRRAREVDCKRMETRSLRLRSHYHMHVGEMEAADRDLRQALQQARIFGRMSLVIAVLSAMGTFYKDQGELETSIRVHEEGIRLCRETGARFQESVLLGNLALVVQLQGNLTHAVALYEETIALTEEANLPVIGAMALGNWGDLLSSREDLEESAELLEKAIERLDSAGHSAAASFRGSLAWVCGQRGEFDRSRRLLERAEDVHRGVWPFELGRLLCRRAQVEFLAGEVEAAQAAFREAVEIAESIGAGADSDLGQLITDAKALLEVSARG